MQGPAERAVAATETSVDGHPELKRGAIPKLRHAARLFALGLVAIALVVPASPAHASHNTVAWTTPEGATPTISGNQSLKLEVNSPAWIQNGRVREWELRLRNSANEQLSVMCADDYGIGGDDQILVNLTWDTTFLPSAEEPGGTGCDTGTPSIPAAPSSYSLNGTYNLQVWLLTTPSGLPPTAHEETFDRTVLVDNAPQAPLGAKAVWNATAQRTTVSWDANPEPDVSGYAVDQCVKSSASQTCSASDWSRVSNPAGRTTTVAQFDATGPGAYRYRVAARRPHADAALGEWFSSATQTEPIAVASTEVSPTTTTTPDEANGGSGGGSGTTGPGGTGGGGTTGGAAGGKPASGGSGSGGETDRSGLPPRTVQRTEVDAGYDEKLPYGGVGPLDGVDGGPLEIATRGVGIALVPMAMGTLLFVFAMQMRYLSRRADGFALAGDGALSLDGDDLDHAEHEPVPLLSLGAGGSFISNWKRLLDDAPGPSPRE